MTFITWDSIADETIAKNPLVFEYPTNRRFDVLYDRGLDEVKGVCFSYNLADWNDYILWKITPERFAKYADMVEYGCLSIYNIDL